MLFLNYTLLLKFLSLVIYKMSAPFSTSVLIITWGSLLKFRFYKQYRSTLWGILLYQTGHNGTINGQGQSWWTKYKKKLLSYTRGPLVQIMWSTEIVISNITLRDSPFWTLHPYDCKNVTISNVTILAPVTGAPNTDGIDPGKHAFQRLILVFEF